MVTILQKANTQVEHVNITATELAEEGFPLQLYKLMWNSNLYSRKYFDEKITGFYTLYLDDVRKT